MAGAWSPAHQNIIGCSNIHYAWTSVLASRQFIICTRACYSDLLNPTDIVEMKGWAIKTTTKEFKIACENTKFSAGLFHFIAVILTTQLKTDMYDI